MTATMQRKIIKTSSFKKTTNYPFLINIFSACFGVCEYILIITKAFDDYFYNIKTSCKIIPLFTLPSQILTPNNKKATAETVAVIVF